MIRCDPSAKFCFGGNLIVVKKLQKKRLEQNIRLFLNAEHLME